MLICAHTKSRIFTQSVTSFVLVTFVSSLMMAPRQSYAQSGVTLPAPGTMVSVSPAFTPPIIRGVTIHPENPLKLDFIVDSGDDRIAGEELKEESGKLVRYFMAALTVPEDQLWVNLSPYEKDRIIPQHFGQTEMGRDLLAQDYLLKQLTSSLMYPENELGQKFWDRVYAKAQEMLGTTDIPTNTFNKIWIVPQKAVVYEHGATAFVVESSLKVMLEEDYLASQKNLGNDKHKTIEPGTVETMNEYSSQIIREILIPEIEHEINTGKNFAALRQIYNSVILATWYKNNFKESFLGQAYVDQNKIKGVELEDKQVKEEIYAQYLESFKKGAYDYVREDYDPVSQEIIPRKYFSGGVELKINYEDGRDTAPVRKLLENRVLHNIVTSNRPDNAMQPSRPITDFKSLTLSVIENKAKDAEAVFMASVERIIQIPAEDRTFDMVAALEEARAKYMEDSGLDDNDLLESIGPEKVINQETGEEEAIDEKAGEMAEETRQVLRKVFASERLYNAIDEYARKGEQLEGEDKKLFEETVKEFMRSGFGLSDDTESGGLSAESKRIKVIEIKKLISEKEREFRKNVSASKNHIILKTDKDFEGLSDDYIAHLKDKMKDGDDIKVTLSQPDYFPFMQMAASEKKRKELYFASGQVASENKEILNDLLRLRQALAELFGYDDYISYSMQDQSRMIQDPDEVSGILHGQIMQLLPQAQSEDEKLLELKIDEYRKNNPDATEEQIKQLRIEPWDRPYFSAQRKRNLIVDKYKEKFGSDAFGSGLTNEKFEAKIFEEIRQYFPLDGVMSGAMKFFGKMFGLEFKKVEYEKPADNLAWHSDVSLYEIFDAKTRDLKGRIYFDLHPRPGSKRGGATSYTLVNGRLTKEGYHSPVGVMVGNFTEPVGGQPALLRFSEGITFLHEFGHLTHLFRTLAQYARLSGLNVAMDYAEFPSQLFENLAWNYNFIKELSGRIDVDPETGKVTRTKLPRDLFEAIMAGKDYENNLGIHKASLQLKMAAVALTDMEYHSGFEGDTTEVYRKFSEMIGHSLPEGTHPETSITHLASENYASAYSSYSLADRIVAQALERFDGERVLDPNVWKAWDEEILAWGSARPEIDSLNAFLKRTAMPDGNITDTKGGIDLDPTTMNMEIKRDGKGAPMPTFNAPVENIHIDGLLPVIINITPIIDIQMLLGEEESPPVEQLSRS